MFHWAYNLDSTVTQNIQITLISDTEEEIVISYEVNNCNGELQFDKNKFITHKGKNHIYCNGTYGSYTIIAENEKHEKQYMTLNILDFYCLNTEEDQKQE